MEPMNFILANEDHNVYQVCVIYYVLMYYVLMYYVLMYYVLIYYVLIIMY
jgi:hypothetical protein